MLKAYHELAQTIWPMSQPNFKTTPSKLQTPLTNAFNRQLKRLTKLRNSANQHLHTMTKHKNPTPPIPPDPCPHPDSTPALAKKVLHLPETPKLEDIPSLCHKSIASIIGKASHKLMDMVRKKEDALYKKSPKRYHANLKTVAGLQTRAKDQPNLATVRDPATNEITSYPQTIVDTIQSYYKREHERTTPYTIIAPRWENPNNLDPYYAKRKDPNQTQHPLDHYLTRGHYTLWPAKGPRQERPPALTPCPRRS